MVPIGGLHCLRALSTEDTAIASVVDRAILAAGNHLSGVLVFLGALIDDHPGRLQLRRVHTGFDPALLQFQGASRDPIVLPSGVGTTVFPNGLRRRHPIIVAQLLERDRVQRALADEIRRPRPC